MNVLDKETVFSRCRSWHEWKLCDDGSFKTEDGSEGPFEVVIIPRVSYSASESGIPIPDP